MAAVAGTTQTVAYEAQGALCLDVFHESSPWVCSGQAGAAPPPPWHGAWPRGVAGLLGHLPLPQAVRPLTSSLPSLELFGHRGLGLDAALWAILAAGLWNGCI